MTDIVENEKRTLSEIIEKRLIGSRNNIYYFELINQKIPTFLKNYLQNFVRKLVYTEEPIQFRNSKRFDVEYPKIQQLRRELLEAFEQVAIFSRDEIKKAIAKTIDLQFDLIVRPRATLLRIFFGNKSDQKKTEILSVLEGLKDGRIFLNRLVEKIYEFDQFHLVETDFDRIISQTEKEIYNDNFIDSILSDLKCYLNFLEMIGERNRNEIKTNLVRLFLAERNLVRYLNALETFQEEKITLNTLKSLLMNYQVNEKFLQEEDAISETVKKEEWDRANSKEVKGANLVEGQIRIDQGANSEAEETSLSQSGKKVNGKIILDSDDSNFIINREDIERQPEGPLEAMENIIDEKSRKLIVKKIFDQDCEAYEEFIKEINSVDNWKEAKFIIDRELNRRHVRPYSKEALRLGDLAFVRYFPGKKF